MTERGMVLVRIGLPTEVRSNGNQKRFAHLAELMVREVCPPGVRMCLEVLGSEEEEDLLQVSVSVDGGNRRQRFDMQRDLLSALEKLFVDKSKWMAPETRFRLATTVDEVVCDTQGATLIAQKRVISNPTSEELWDGVPDYSVSQSLYRDDSTGQWFATLEGEDVRPLPGRTGFRLLTEEEARSLLGEDVVGSGSAIDPDEVPLADGESE